TTNSNRLLSLSELYEHFGESPKLLTEIRYKTIRGLPNAYDLKGNFIQTNSKFSEIIGYSLFELTTKTVYEITHSEDIDITKSFYSDFIGKGNERAELEKRYVHKNGNIVWVFMSISLITKQDNSSDFFVAHIQDITQKKADEELIRKLSKSVEQSPVMVVISDLDGKLEYVNSKFEEITGYAFAEVRTKNPRILSSEYQDQAFYEKLWETIEAGKIWTGEFVNKKKNGEEYWESASISAIIDSHNKPTHYLAIKQDITAQKLMEKALIIAKEKAEESDRLKSAFLANVSHEIRTPMNGILGFSELLEEDNVSQNQQHEYIKVIRKSGHQLLGIVSDILDISKLESGQLRITNEVFSVYDLFHESLLIFEDRIKKNSKSITIELKASADETVFIKTDRLRLTQILQNLLSNAEKFTEKGSIEFGYEISNDHLHVFVSDTGKGIEYENIESIFDRFRQEDEAISKAFGGTGLGLSISKGLAKLLGGEISAKSKIGVGSTFSFFIKIEGSTETPLVNQADNDNNMQFNGEIILIVEDVKENYDLLHEYLTSRNLTVIRAEKGIEGIEICTIRKDIQLVLMDIKLPDINGYDATIAIKRINAHLPIIAQTAYAMENEKQKCLDAGCDDYLSKPIQFKKLNKVLAKYIN
ncbi:MAG: PAS domain S-box protein, partial [Prolixibacteraceae bacterium]|nr:PAS domain S-box protein [Prolixibacteraceae bacterium]